MERLRTNQKERKKEESRGGGGTETVGKSEGRWREGIGNKKNEERGEEKKRGQRRRRGGCKSAYFYSNSLSGSVNQSSSSWQPGRAQTHPHSASQNRNPQFSVSVAKITL